LANPGGEPPDAATVRSDGEAECGVAGASRVEKQAVAAEKSILSEPRTQRCLEETLLEAVVACFQDPGRAVGSAGAIRARNRKWKGSLGDEWVYPRGRWKAKMEIPD